MGKMTTEVVEKATYTNSVLEANMKRQEQMIKEAKARKKEEDKEKRAFERNKDKRAAGWQVFKQNLDTKRFKTETWAKVGQVGAGNRHWKQEERRDADGKGEIDRDDKKILKSDTQAGQ